MELAGDCLDHVLHKLYSSLVAEGGAHEGSRGKTLEILNVSLHIAKPRARLSISENRGKPFSALGELLWYLSGSDALAFIEPYVPRYRDDAVEGILEGAYGPRLLGMRDGVDQLDSVVRLLSRNPGSRRAVIQLFNAEDIATRHKEIPCTTTLQFHVRDGRLHLSVTLRSNDAYLGLPHDVFCFTMLQEMMARRLEVDLGEYHQFVGSMHVYEDCVEKAKAYLTEGYQQVRQMPAMPDGDPFKIVPELLVIEARLRAGEEICAADAIAGPYWQDVVRLLQVFWARHWSDDHPGRLKQLRAELESTVYRPYVDGRRFLAGRAPGSANLDDTHDRGEHVA